MTFAPCTAIAGANVALVKYWGKRQSELNLPATGSLSLTLREMGTTTTVQFAPALTQDHVTLNGVGTDARTTARVRAFLDLVRVQAKLTLRAEVVTVNTVPTASGIASSASGFAALALAASRAASLELSPVELSELARRGSGSAARSIFGGFVEMQRGTRTDGADSVARPLSEGEGWDVRMVIVMTSTERKSIGSTEAMERAALTSPYFVAWLASIDRDLTEARAAIAAHDLSRLGAITERNCLRMHATTLSSEPPIVYWNATTLDVMRTVGDLRAAGIPAFFTIDAGPHVKVLCAARDAENVHNAVRIVPGVVRCVVASPGPGAHLLESVQP